MPTLEAAVILDEPVSVQDFIEFTPGRYLQVCNAQVTVGDRLNRYRLLISPESVWAVSSLRAEAMSLISEPSDVKVALIADLIEGKAVVCIDDRHESEVAEIAAAVAVMMVCWSWDESSFIVVQVNNFRCLVWTRFNENHRVAEVFGWKTSPQ